MRQLLTLLLTLGLTINLAHAAPAVVVHGKSVGTAGPTLAAPINVGDTTTAQLGIVGMSGYNANFGTGSITDNYSNTWVKVGYNATGNDETQLAYCVNPCATGPNHTITFAATGSANYSAFYVAFFSGINSTAAIVGSNHNGAASAAGVSPGSVTPFATGDLVVSVVSEDAATGNVFTVGSSFTIIDQNNDPTGWARNGALAWLIAPSTSGVNPAWGGATTGNWDSAIATFKAGTAPPPATNDNRLSLLGVGN